METLKNKDRQEAVRERTDERAVIEIDSEAEKIQEIFRRTGEEQRHDDRWRAIQSEYRGKDGTAKLKEWCQENDIPYIRIKKMQ